MTRPILIRFLSALLAAASVLNAQPAKPPPRAVPVEEEPPVPKAVPIQPGTVNPPAKPPEENKPTGPDEDLFDYATMIYERQEYQLAAQSLAKYLQNYPGGRHVPLALFRLGECYMKQKQLKVAEAYYEEVVNRYPNSEGAPSAAYRLGAMRFNEKEFEKAARFFTFCETKTTLPEVRLAAGFNKSRAYQMLGDTSRQIAALKDVVAVKENNEYRGPALLSLGTLLLAQDKKDEALPLFQELLSDSKDNTVIAEAAVKAGVLLAETGKPDEAVPLFEKALAMSETSAANRSIAMVGVIQAMFAKGNYDGVIDHYHRNASVLPPGDTRPKMLLMVGNAYRMKKSYSRAVEVYLMIEQDYKDTEPAFEAGYWKLYCFYLLDDKDLGDFVTGFLQRYAAKRFDHEYINLARLIRADFYFNKQAYKEAGESFAEVQIDKLPEKLKAGTLFNKAWSHAEAHRLQEAIGSFTQFIADYPTHEFRAKALARRGLAYREAQDLPKALADFQRVVKEHPNSEAAEMAYLQMGLVAMTQRDLKTMVASFEALVAKYPNSAAASQAWYGIGRGYFDQKEWDKAIPALRRSIEVDKENNLERANQMLIICYYVKQDPNGLAQTIDDFRKANPNAHIPPNELTWLGLKLYEQKDFKRAAKFLTMASTPDAPENTDPRVWNYLGMSLLETREYDESVKATDYYLARTPESAAKARGLLTKGRALLGQAKFVDADKVVQEGLQFAKDGKPQALLLILQGDILYAEGEQQLKNNQADAAKEKFIGAASKYMVPGQFFQDDEVTPMALDKAARALEAAGDKDKANQLREQLKREYPRFQPAS